ncbi:MAG TPA: type II toxin-antitoxin system Phd/YefM family antitoxin [Gemmatales bacterium]|nr:type II toxin-antitoxin system Phd/YefM family antitoxin [Gemmatales bacterium]
MCIVSSAEFQRHVGEYQDRALVEPVIITRNGRERLVMIAVDEYRRLKRRDREALPVTALAEQDLEAIARAEIPEEYAHFDDELNG